MGAGITFGCPYACAHALKGFLLAELGELEQARRLLEQGRSIAREQGDIEGVGLCHIWSAWLAYFAGEPEAALGHAQQALEIAERIGDSFSRALRLVLPRLCGADAGRVAACDRGDRALHRDRKEGAHGRRAGRCPPRADSASHTWVSAIRSGRAPSSRRGFEIARARRHPTDETYASLALARVLLVSDGAAARAEIEASLSRALELARANEAKIFQPLIHVELAELARQSGNHGDHAEQLRIAHRLFRDIGATGQAKRLEVELATTT